jgi:hypothetical protein
MWAPDGADTEHPPGKAVLAALVLLLIGLGDLSRAALDLDPRDRLEGGALDGRRLASAASTLQYNLNLG